MASLNKVFLIGNLTRDPEVRWTPSGSAVCELGLAVNRRYTQNGQEQNEPCFVDIVIWEKQAEACGKFLQKGASLFVEGRLQYDSWVDKEQKKRSRIRVVAERVQFLDRRDPSQDQGQSQYQGQPYQGQNQYQGQGMQSTPRDSYYQRRQMPPQDNGGYASAPAREPSYQQPGRYTQSVPPQMPVNDDSQIPAADADPTRSAPFTRKSAAPAVPPPEPPEDPAGIVDDIPF